MDHHSWRKRELIQAGIVFAGGPIASGCRSAWMCFGSHDPSDRGDPLIRIVYFLDYRNRTPNLGANIH